MKRRLWSIRRATIVTTDAVLRWDHAYQCLIQGSPQSVQPSPEGAMRQESRHEDRLVCSGVYPTAGTNPNH